MVDEQTTPTPQQTTGNDDLKAAIARLSQNGGLNMDAPVVRDGKTYTVGQLVDLAREAERLKEENAGLTKFRDDVKTFFNTDDVKTGQEVARRVYSGIGVPQDELEALVSQIGKQPTEEGGGGNQNNAAQPQEQKPVQQDNKQLEALRKVQHETVRQHLRERVEAAVRNDDTLKRSLEYIRSRPNGEERAQKVEQRIVGSVMNDTIDKYNQHYNTTGEVNIGKLYELVGDSLNVGREEVGLFLGDPASLGRSDEDIRAAQEREEFLQTEPKTFNTDEAEDYGTASQQVKDVMVDSLSRGALELEHEGAGGAA